MGEELLTGHWKKQLDTNWAGAWCLAEAPNNTADVVIEGVYEMRDVKVQGKLQDVMAVKFKPNAYVNVPMILKSTNAKSITAVRRQLAKTDKEKKNAAKMETWKGMKITLVMIIGDAFGEKNVEMLRVSRTPPPQDNNEVKKEKMTPSSEKFAAALNSLREGRCDIKYITDKYDVDENAMLQFNVAIEQYNKQKGEKK